MGYVPKPYLVQGGLRAYGSSPLLRSSSGAVRAVSKDWMVPPLTKPLEGAISVVTDAADLKYTPVSICRILYFPTPLTTFFQDNSVLIPANNCT
jgi:hypothetical protein